MTGFWASLSPSVAAALQAAAAKKPPGPQRRALVRVVLYVDRADGSSVFPSSEACRLDQPSDRVLHGFRARLAFGLTLAERAAADAAWKLAAVRVVEVPNATDTRAIDRELKALEHQSLLDHGWTFPGGAPLPP